MNRDTNYLSTNKLRGFKVQIECPFCFKEFENRTGRVPEEMIIARHCDQDFAVHIQWSYKTEVFVPVNSVSETYPSRVNRRRINEDGVAEYYCQCSMVGCPETKYVPLIGKDKDVVPTWYCHFHDGLEKFGLSPRVMWALRRHNVSFGVLEQMTDLDLVRLDGIGVKSIVEIETAIKNYNIKSIGESFEYINEDSE